jgi:diguanylate cyclase (GGDEF)-like protein/PAS domain S-box-containing protein
LSNPDNAHINLGHNLVVCHVAGSGSSVAGSDSASHATISESDLNRTTAIQSAQLQQLLSVSRVSLIASVSLALVLVYVQRGVIASSVLVFWMLLILLASLLRAVTVIAYQRHLHESDICTRMTHFRLGVLGAGVVWGLAGFLLFPENNPQHQIFLIFTLAGMTAGGTIAFSADLFSAVGFALTLITPLIIRLFVAGDSISAAMGAATLLYLVFMVTSMRRINRQVYENIVLHLEAIGREEQVRSSEERYRLLLAHLPVGVIHYDADLVITYCNQSFTIMLNNTAERLVGLDMKRLKDQSILPALRKALAGETGHYEGRYHATFSDADRWIYMTCTPSLNDRGEIVGGIGIVQDITGRKEAEETIKNLAFYDHLTDIPNRRLLLERLQHAMVSSAHNDKTGALLFIDLDNFKAINDTLGHDMGDLLLQQVARRLVSCLREGDSVARLGGDEFVVLLEDLSSHTIEAAAQTEAVAEHIQAELGQPYRLATHEYLSTSSIGATLFQGHRQSIEELMKQADIAMYQAKRAGRNVLRFFDQEMQNAVTARAILENELRSALEKRQFRLYYQVQVDHMLHPLGAEALLRWEHPERGVVSPTDFIQVAEETDLIVPIGQWALETACAQLKAWQHNPLTRNLGLTVNVSAKQFRRPDFVARMQETVRQSGINPMRLKLELTESALLDDIEGAIAVMDALRQSGIRFSLDDFGTGYSSLQYLKRLPLDQLKIDRSFVRDIATDSNDAAIVRTIIAMAQSMNLGVIAEGVETEEQRQHLLNHGCNHYQGYLFGRPVPVEQFEAQLQQEVGELMQHKLWLV